MSIVDLSGGPLDGRRMEWPDPLPPELRFPVSPRLTITDYAETDPSTPIPVTYLLYKHRSLGLYDFIRKESR